MSALQETFDLMEFFTSKKDSKKIMELNRTFHRTIYDTAGSRFLSQILKAYEEYVEQTRKVTVYCGDNLAQILKEHGEILEAIKNKDSKMAMEKTSVHLNNSRRRAEKSIITK